MAGRDDPGAGPPHIGGPLDPLNDAFHSDYGRARADAELDGPVLVLLGDELTLVAARVAGTRPGAPKVVAFTPRVFHAVKTVAHLPVALFAIVHRAHSTDPGCRAQAEQALARIEALVHAAITGLADDVPDPATRDDCRDVLERSRGFIDELRAHSPAVGDGRLERFAHEIGPRILPLIDHATREQLTALHERTRELLGGLSAEQRERLHVVVAGAHQARARSLAMQYFERMLGEPRDAEERVTYAEAVDTVAAAVELVGTQRLDRVMARAFFGDQKRLQRDVLGDAAKRMLDAAELDAASGDRSRQ